MSRDTSSAEAVVYSGIPLTLIPFELAASVTITASDAERLRAGDATARWLGEITQPWISYWTGPLMHQDGFHPFDALAVAYVAMPEQFECRRSRPEWGSARSSSRSAWAAISRWPRTSSAPR